MRRYFLMTILSIMLLTNTALSASTPASLQNDHQRPCILDCNACSDFSSCASCRFCSAVLATARPRPASAYPTPAPTAQPVIRPTAAPVKTAAPRPTFRPALQPTLRPTYAPSISTGDYTTLSVTVQEQKALNLLNADRAAQGLPPLALDPELSRIARIKSQDMKDNRYFAHVSPTYGNAATMLKTFGYSFNGAGENIAHHATVEKSQAAFMSSNSHRRNILGKQWQKVGIGICYDDQGFVYVTQLFVR